jgi:diaminopimelate epimerase
MRFQKWQALGNDYVIVDVEALPFELTPPRIRRLCAAHTGVGSDGVLLLAAPERSGSVARLRIYNPDGSEAELSGNGARQAVLYLRRQGWTDRDEFSLDTAAGEVQPRITGPNTCTMAMGRAKLTSDAYPSGGEDGRGTLTVDGREFAFQHISVGNPQCAIEIVGDLEGLDVGRYGPLIERHELFPSRTNVSFWRRDAESEVTARIFERGVGETLSSGTGASGAAVAAVLRGATSPVTVHLEGGDLEVGMSEDLDVSLSGWALPVYAGALSDELVAELESLEEGG